MTLSKTIGELAPVPIRDVWPDEARDLTPWLAENPEALGRALGMDLELDGSEVAVGPFSADLLKETCAEIEKTFDLPLEWEPLDRSREVEWHVTTPRRRT